MKPGRNQFTIGGVMIAVAVLAVGLAHPEFSGGLLIGGVVPIALLAVLASIHYLFVKPCLSLVDSIERRYAARDRPRPGPGP